MTGSVRPQPDPVVKLWLARAGEIAVGIPEAAWPDRQRARSIAARLFEEFGQPPPDGVSRDELRWMVDGRELRVVEYAASAAPHGTVVRVHGGGFVFGSVDEPGAVAMASRRAARTGATVIDVDYRLAPEHPFPAAVVDVVDALRRVLDRRAPGGVVLEGVSSGAGLAVAAALQVAVGGCPLAGLVLQIPSLDLRPEAPWLAAFAHIGGLSPRDLVREQYLQGADPADPMASPAAGDLRALPPTHVITAEFDPLREVGERFVDALRRSGVPVTATRHLGAAHGSGDLTGVSRDARLWQSEVDAVIRDFLGADA